MESKLSAIIDFHVCMVVSRKSLPDLKCQAFLISFIYAVVLAKLGMTSSPSPSPAMKAELPSQPFWLYFGPGYIVAFHLLCSLRMGDREQVL